MEEAARIQSTVPVDAVVIPPVGTAPGLITWRRLRKRPLVVVLPGPLTELLAMWQRAIDTPPLRELLPRNVPRAHRVIRMTGQESDLRVAIREIGRTRVRLNQLIISTCWEGGKELRLDVVFSPSAARVRSVQSGTGRALRGRGLLARRTLIGRGFERRSGGRRACVPRARHRTPSRPRVARPPKIVKKR